MSSETEWLIRRQRLHNLSRITTAGERWDLLAWKYYGDATLYAPIIAANWSRIMAGLLSVDAVFNAGVIIGVPVLLVNNAVDPANLPPWKR